MQHFGHIFRGFIIKQVASNKSSKFNTEHYFTEHTNITTKLKWKLFTKVMKMPGKEAWVWIGRESN